MFTKLLVAIFFSFAITSTSFAQQTAAGPIQNEDLRKLCVDHFAKSQYQSRLTYRYVSDGNVEYKFFTFHFDTAGVIRVSKVTQRPVCEVTLRLYDERFNSSREPFLFEFDGVKAEQSPHTSYTVLPDKSLALKRRIKILGKDVEMSGVLSRTK